MATLPFSTTQVYLLFGAVTILLFLSGLSASFFVFNTRLDTGTLRTFLLGFGFYMLFYFAALYVYRRVEQSQ